MLSGPVTQLGQSGWLLTNKSWVQIPPGPLRYILLELGFAEVSTTYIIETVGLHTA